MATSIRERLANDTILCALDRTASTPIDPYRISTPCRDFASGTRKICSQGLRFLYARLTGVLESTKLTMFLLCSRQESNLYWQLRKLLSYPLNDESESPGTFVHRSNSETLPRLRLFSKPEPGGEEVGKLVFMLFFLYVVEEVFVDAVGVYSLERDHEVRREPAFVFDRE